jgi:hypothetical protein
MDSKAKTTYRPVDDEIVGRSAASLHIVRVLVGHILRGQADLGVAGGERVSHLQIQSVSLVKWEN